MKSTRSHSNLVLVFLEPRGSILTGVKNNNSSSKTAAYEFQPVAVETHGPMDEATISFISELRRKISEYSGDPFDSRYFFQRVSMLIQRYSSILFCETFPIEDEIDT